MALAGLKEAIDLAALVNGVSVIEGASDPWWVVVEKLYWWLGFFGIYLSLLLKIRLE